MTTTFVGVPGHVCRTRCTIHVANALTINGTGSLLTAGQGPLPQGGGGSGYVLAGADC